MSRISSVSTLFFFAPGASNLMYRNYELERIYSYFLISFNSAQWFKTFWTVFILPPLRLCWPGRKQYFSVSTPVSRPLSLKHVWHSNRHDSF